VGGWVSRPRFAYAKRRDGGVLVEASVRPGVSAMVTCLVLVSVRCHVSVMC